VSFRGERGSDRPIILPNLARTQDVGQVLCQRNERLDDSGHS